MKRRNLNPPTANQRAVAPPAPVAPAPIASFPPPPSPHYGVNHISQPQPQYQTPAQYMPQYQPQAPPLQYQQPPPQYNPYQPQAPPQQYQPAPPPQQYQQPVAPQRTQQQQPPQQPPSTKGKQPLTLPQTIHILLSRINKLEHYLINNPINAEAIADTSTQEIFGDISARLERLEADVQFLKKGDDRLAALEADVQELMNEQPLPQSTDDTASIPPEQQITLEISDDDEEEDAVAAETLIA